MLKTKYPFVILGAGVSGLTSAYQLSKRFPGDVLVLEKERQIGGLLRTVNRNGARYDLGSHRIHKNPSPHAFRIIQEVCPGKIVKNERGGKLRLKKSYIDYPITSFQMFRSIGLIESGLCAVSLIHNRVVARLKKDIPSEDKDNYEGYLMRRAGKRAYRLFYEPYARKVWGGEPSLISTTAVKKRISMLSPTLFLKDMISHYTGRSRDGYYYYVQGGMSVLAESLGGRIRERGCPVVTGVADFSLRMEPGKKTIEFASPSPSAVEFDTLITTIPLDDLFRKLSPPASILRQVQSITWRGLRLVFLHVEGEPLLDGESFYFPELAYPFGRVSIPKRFDPAMQPGQGLTALTCEIPCAENDSLWKTPDGRMFELCMEGLRKAALVSKDQNCLPEKSFTINLPKIYPVYRIGWDKNVQSLLSYSAERYPFIYFSGKPGLFLHCNIDHSMDIGTSVAEVIDQGGSARQWSARLNAFHNLKLRD